jgi:hypothetical protein
MRNCFPRRQENSKYIWDFLCANFSDLCSFAREGVSFAESFWSRATSYASSARARSSAAFNFCSVLGAIIFISASGLMTCTRTTQRPERAERGDERGGTGAMGHDCPLPDVGPHPRLAVQLARVGRRTQAADQSPSPPRPRRPPAAAAAARRRPAPQRCARWPRW